MSKFNYTYNLWIKDEQTLLRKQADYHETKDSLKLFEESMVFYAKEVVLKTDNNYDENFPALLRSSFFTELINH